jgi:hypothetical protein
MPNFGNWSVLRFVLGLVFGICLTGEALFIAGVGHGSYAPMAFVSSLTVFQPLIAIVVGPLVWAVYFLLIPNLQGRRASLSIWGMLLLHLGPGFWLAYDDPAFVRTDLWLLLVFSITFLAAIGSLLLFTRRTF